jgi:hypothetical protein
MRFRGKLGFIFAALILISCVPLQGADVPIIDTTRLTNFATVRDYLDLRVRLDEIIARNSSATKIVDEVTGVLAADHGIHETNFDWPSNRLEWAKNFATNFTELRRALNDTAIITNISLPSPYLRGDTMKRLDEETMQAYLAARESHSRLSLINRDLRMGWRQYQEFVMPHFLVPKYTYPPPTKEEFEEIISAFSNSELGLQFSNLVRSQLQMNSTSSISQFTLRSGKSISTSVDPATGLTIRTNLPDTNQWWWMQSVTPTNGRGSEISK